MSHKTEYNKRKEPKNPDEKIKRKNYKIRTLKPEDEKKDNNYWRIIVETKDQKKINNIDKKVETKDENKKNGIRSITFEQKDENKVKKHESQIFEIENEKKDNHKDMERENTKFRTICNDLGNIIKEINYVKKEDNNRNKIIETIEGKNSLSKGREWKSNYLFQGKDEHKKMDLEKNNFFQLKKIMKRILDLNEIIKLKNINNIIKDDKGNKKENNIIGKRRKYSRNIIFFNYLILIIFLTQKTINMKMGLFSLKSEIILK